MGGAAATTGRAGVLGANRPAMGSSPEGILDLLETDVTAIAFFATALCNLGFDQRQIRLVL
jgi:hypothetical protein